MGNGTYYATRFENLVKQTGRTITFYRDYGLLTEQSAEVVARVNRFRNALRYTSLTESAVEDTFMLICGVQDFLDASWPIPPRQHDRVLVDDNFYTILTVYPLYLQDGVLTGYRVQLDG